MTKKLYGDFEVLFVALVGMILEMYLVALGMICQEFQELIMWVLFIVFSAQISYSIGYCRGRRND